MAAGNEGAARHHYMGNTGQFQEGNPVELKVGKKEASSGFSMEFWGDSPDFYNLSVQSPTGERLSISTALKYTTQKLSFCGNKSVDKLCSHRKKNRKYFRIFSFPSSGGGNLENPGGG